MSRELEPLATGAGSGSNDSDTEDIRMEPHARVQPMRLTFDTNDEPVLIAVSGDQARVQRQTIDQDEECVLVVQDVVRDFLFIYFHCCTGVSFTLQKLKVYYIINPSLVLSCLSY